MNGFYAGPRLLVHILLITMVNALFFPILCQWLGSILYAFLVSVGILCIYGAISLRLFNKR